MLINNFLIRPVITAGRFVIAAGWFTIAVGIAAITCVSAGCSDSLETGYQYKRLGATPMERRAYYAPPFTPEAAAAAGGSRDRDDFRPTAPVGRTSGGYR